MTSSPFTRDFQVSIIKLLFQDFSFLIFGVEVLDPGFFEDKTLIRLFQIMKQHYEQYSSKISQTNCWNEIEKDYAAKRIKDDQVDDFRELIDSLHEPVDGAEYVQSEVVRWCKRQAVRKAMLESAAMTDSEDPDVWDQIYTKIGQAVRVGDNSADKGIHYFRDYESRTQAREKGDDRLIIPTAIHSLDTALKGGPRSGQMALWMAVTGGGKSLALVHVGKHAVARKYKVVHYTLELDELETADRYDATFANVSFQDLQFSTGVINTKLGELGTKFGDSLIIKGYPTKMASVVTIKGHLENLVNSGFKPDMIIVDYLDLLKPTTNYNSQYEDLGAIAGDLRGLAGTYNAVLWSATQANRSGSSAEVIDVEHIGDSLQKAQIADIIIAICMNRDERAANKARLFVAKNRNGPGKIQLPIATMYEKMKLYNRQATEVMIDLAKEKQDMVKSKTVKKSIPTKQAPSLPAPVAQPVAAAPRRRPMNTVKFPVDDGDP